MADEMVSVPANLQRQKTSLGWLGKGQTPSRPKSEKQFLFWVASLQLHREQGKSPKAHRISIIAEKEILDSERH